MAFYRRFRADMFIVWNARLENMQPHDVAGRIVERQRKKVEIDDGVEALRKVMKKFGQIALL
jgi:hypothetical protein